MVVGTCGCLSQTKPRPRKVCLVHGHSEPYSAKQHTWNLWSATKKTVSPKTCHTSPRSQQGKPRSGLVRRSSEAPQLCTSCGFVWGDNGPFTAVLMAKCCLFVPQKIGPGFGWYPVRRLYRWRSKTMDFSDLSVSKSAGSTTILEHHIPEKRHVCLPASWISWAQFFAIHVHKTIEII